MKPAAYMPKTAFAIERRDYIKAIADLKGGLPVSPGHSGEKELRQKLR